MVQSAPAPTRAVEFRLLHVVGGRLAPQKKPTKKHTVHDKRPEPRSTSQLFNWRVPWEFDLGGDATLRGKKVQLCGEHAGKEAGIPRTRRADGEMQDHAHRHQDSGTIRQLVQSKEPGEEEHGAS